MQHPECRTLPLTRARARVEEGGTHSSSWVWAATFLDRAGGGRKDLPRCQSGSIAGSHQVSVPRTQLPRPHAQAYWFPCRCHTGTSSQSLSENLPDSALPLVLRRNTAVWARPRPRESAGALVQENRALPSTRQTRWYCRRVGARPEAPDL